MPTSTPAGLPQGTLDLLILQTLARGPRHGYGVARWIEDATDDALVSKRDRCIRRCTEWSGEAGSLRAGRNQSWARTSRCTR
jgi:hypothetical protein